MLIVGRGTILFFFFLPLPRNYRGTRSRVVKPRLTKRFSLLKKKKKMARRNFSLTGYAWHECINNE